MKASIISRGSISPLSIVSNRWTITAGTSRFLSQCWRSSRGDGQKTWQERSGWLGTPYIKNIIAIQRRLFFCVVNDAVIASRKWDRRCTVVWRHNPLRSSCLRNTSYENQVFGVNDIQNMVHTMYTDNHSHHVDRKPIAGRGIVMQAPGTTAVTWNVAAVVPNLITVSTTLIKQR